jgi:DUF2914 family protein/tetratricopeptide repeat protein
MRFASQDATLGNCTGNAVACRSVDFGFGDLDTNAAGEPPSTGRPKRIVTVELDLMARTLTMRPPPSASDLRRGARDAMSEPRNVQNMLAEAERAASAGDLVSAEELLRDAARLQETELGPLHPDLANTLNNLAIITEKEGRPREAERAYRRAVEIAMASLPPDDPMVAASRQNLEDFCHAHGLPVEKPAVIEPAGSEAPALPTPAAQTWSPVSKKAWGGLAVIAIGIVVLLVAAFLLARPQSPRQELATVRAAVPKPPSTAESAGRAPDALAPIDRPHSPAPVAITLATVQLCQSFSTSDWHCDPAGDSVSPGTIVLYTRIRSPHDVVIVHRWYRGDALRMSARLRIGANAAEGYRTYSRQSVDSGDWRVEVRSADGDLLHEQRFSVQ